MLPLILTCVCGSGPQLCPFLIKSCKACKYFITMSILRLSCPMYYLNISRPTRFAFEKLLCCKWLFKCCPMRWLFCHIRRKDGIFFIMMDLGIWSSVIWWNSVCTVQHRLVGLCLGRTRRAGLPGLLPPGCVSLVWSSREKLQVVSRMIPPSVCCTAMCFRLCRKNAR